MHPYGSWLACVAILPYLAIAHLEACTQEQLVSIYCGHIDRQQSQIFAF